MIWRPLSLARLLIEDHSKVMVLKSLTTVSFLRKISFKKPIFKGASDPKPSGILLKKYIFFMLQFYPKIMFTVQYHV